MLSEGTVRELQLLDDREAARVVCPEGLTPAAGQYLLAQAVGSDAPLATVLFAAHTYSDGFLTATPIPSTWVPGTQLLLRGPLGHGFALPSAARRIGLVAFQCSPRALLMLLDAAFHQNASVALVADRLPDDLPLEVEAHPLRSLVDTCRWADFIAFDIVRESLPELKAALQLERNSIKAEMQALVRAPMPCGALAHCGVCTIETGGQSVLACDDGPVFDMRQVMGWSSRA